MSWTLATVCIASDDPGSPGNSFYVGSLRRGSRNSERSTRPGTKEVTMAKVLGGR
jgi:hypothetical protein